MSGGTFTGGGPANAEHSGRSLGLDDLLGGLDPDDPRSPSKQIAAQLRAAILAGHVKPGSRLPSQQQLCGRYGVARETVKAALRQLAAEGLISSRQGSRSIVVPRTSEDRFPQSTSQETFARLLDCVSEAHAEAMSAIRGTPDLRQAFDYATRLIARSEEMTEAANDLRTQTAIKIAEEARRDQHTSRVPKTPREG